VGDAAVASSTADVTIISDNVSWSGQVPVVTTGTLTIKPRAGQSFSSAFSTSSLNYSGITGLIIGHSDNTANITIGSEATIAGPITIYGGDIVINAALTASETNTVSLYASGNVTDGASGYIVADKLALIGGTVTLDHASNNIGTIASTSSVGGIKLVNTGNLTIGSITTGGTTYDGINTTGTGTAGASGGTAVYVNRPTTITNNGTLAGGGGGGGGGGGRGADAPEQGTSFASGGGGGGGSGFDAGTGSGRGSSQPGASPAGPGWQPGFNGTSPAGGAGGQGGSTFGLLAGSGGTGGGRGAAGTAGGSPPPYPYGTFAGSAGGGAGAYIVGNPFVTYPATGTRQGPSS
jgi:hypothetical protein